jgi:hypothetical protein
MIICSWKPHNPANAPSGQRGNNAQPSPQQRRNVLQPFAPAQPMLAKHVVRRLKRACDNPLQVGDSSDGRDL